MEHSATNPPTAPVASAPAGLPPARRVPLRSLLPQLDSHTLSLRNHVYATPAGVLRGGRVLAWQDSGLINPVGELRCTLGSSELILAADNLSLLEPRLQGFESFVPSEACTALVEHALSPLIELIEKLAGRPMTCEEFRRAESLGGGLLPYDGLAESSPIRIGFVLLGQDRQPEVRGWMCAAPSLWRSLDFSRTPVQPGTRLQTIPLGLSIQLGQCRLPVAELRQLETGDALRVTPRLAVRREGLVVQLVHSGGGFGCQAQLIGDQLTLNTPMKPLTAAPAFPPASAASARPAEEQLLSNIECELKFEIGSLRLSLTEIAKLRAGQSLRLGVRLQEQPVRILTSGQQIARGELAAVGDELVVVVTDTHGLPPV